jgi:hypothetical protein
VRWGGSRDLGISQEGVVDGQIADLDDCRRRVSRGVGGLECRWRAVRALARAFDGGSALLASFTGEDQWLDWFRTQVGERSPGAGRDRFVSLSWSTDAAGFG